MQNSCRVCLCNENVVLINLIDTRDDRTIADILSFISGIEVKFLILFCELVHNFLKFF